MSRQPTFVLGLGLLLLAGTLVRGGTIKSLPPGASVPAPPLPPYGVYVVPDGEDPTKVTIHWSPGSSDHSGFLVERSESSSAFSQVASTGPAVTEASNQGLFADRRYKYRVRAFKDIGQGKKLFSASSFSQAYQAPIFKGFSGRFTSDARNKYGFRPLTNTADRSERYLEHVLWGDHEWTYNETLTTTNATFTLYRRMETGYYRRSLTQRWQGEYVASGNAHNDYKEKSFGTNSGPIVGPRSDYHVDVQTDTNGVKHSRWMINGTNGSVEASDPIGLAYPYAEVPPTTFTAVSSSYSTNSEDIGSLSGGGSTLSWSGIEFGSAGETVSDKFLNVTFANEVKEDAPALEQREDIPIPAPWHPYHRHLASRTFYDFQGNFVFATDFCVKEMEIHPCDGSDYDYVLEKRTTGNGQGDPEMEYTLTSFQLSGSSTKIEPIDVTEDLTEADADGMINQNADWSVRVAPKLVAFEGPPYALGLPLDEFEKESPGLVVVNAPDSEPCTIFLEGLYTDINNVGYTVEWDSQNFEVVADSQVLESPYVVTAENPRRFIFTIRAKPDAPKVAQTIFRMKAEVDGMTVGEDNVKVCLLPVQMITINTFIPHNNVDDPGNANPFGNDHVFEGDNRIGGTPARATWTKDGAHRTQQKFNVIPFQNMGDADGLEDNAYNASSLTGPKNSPFLNHVGTTHRYEKTSSLDTSGNLTAAARADTTLGDAHLKVAEATAGNSGMKVIPSWLGDRKIKVRCEVKVGNPLAPTLLGNEIDYVFDITIDLTDASNPRYSLEGNHDGFPAYEVYIGNKRVFQHDPLATGEGLGSLLDPLEHDVNETTSHINQPLP